MLAAERFLAVRAAAERCPHGTHARYVAGCHCMVCRAAHSRYNSGRERAKADGDWDGIVDAEPARVHVTRLGRVGMGYKAVAAAAGVPTSTLWAVKTGNRTRIRASALSRILGVDLYGRSDGQLIDARGTWRLLNRLTDDGYTKAQLAFWLGSKTPKLQIQRGQVTVRTAARVERLYRMIQAGRLSR